MINDEGADEGRVRFLDRRLRFLTAALLGVEAPLSSFVPSYGRMERLKPSPGARLSRGAYEGENGAAKLCRRRATKGGANKVALIAYSRSRLWSRLRKKRKRKNIRSAAEVCSTFCVRFLFVCLIVLIAGRDMFQQRPANPHP